MARVSKRGRQQLREWESQNGFSVRHSFLTQFLTKQKEGTNHVNGN